MIKLKIWSNSSSSKLRRFGWGMPYFNVALARPSCFPSVPRLTTKQPQPFDSGIAPASDCPLSQEEGFLLEVIDYRRRSLQGLFIRASGLPSSVFACGPARPLLWSFPCTTSALLLSALFQDSGLHLLPHLAFQSLHSGSWLPDGFAHWPALSLDFTGQPFTLLLWV